MKAWVLHGVGDFRMEIIEVPKIGDNEVLVEVKAAGICGSDIQRVYKTGAHIHPIIIGHEFSGIVVKTGRNVDTRWLGRHIGVYPLIPCGKCVPCQSKAYEMCRHYDYLGSRRDGGFAEYAAVPAGSLAELPGNVGFEEAAMLEPMAVAVHAMRRNMPEKSDTVVICGLGTIGLNLLMFLWESGIRRILAIGNKDFQKQAAMRIGLAEECYFDAGKGPADQWIAENTAGMGADVFFECVGRNETFMQAVSNTAPGGRICLVGNPCSDMKLDQGVYWKILRNQLTITGTWNSSYADASGEGTAMCGGEDDWQYVLERLAKSRVRPADVISHRFSLEELAQGFRIMRDKTEGYGKIMIHN